MESFVLSHPLVADQRYLTVALRLACAADHLDRAERIAAEIGDERVTEEIVSAIDTVNDCAALMLWRSVRAAEPDERADRADSAP